MCALDWVRCWWCTHANALWEITPAYCDTTIAFPVSLVVICHDFYGWWVPALWVHWHEKAFRWQPCLKGKCVRAGRGFYSSEDEDKRNLARGKWVQNGQCRKHLWLEEWVVLYYNLAVEMVGRFGHRGVIYGSVAINVVSEFFHYSQHSPPCTAFIIL